MIDHDQYANNNDYRDGYLAGQTRMRRALDRLRRVVSDGSRQAYQEGFDEGFNQGMEQCE